MFFPSPCISCRPSAAATGVASSSPSPSPTRAAASSTSQSPDPLLESAASLPACSRPFPILPVSPFPPADITASVHSSKKQPPLASLASSASPFFLFSRFSTSVYAVASATLLFLFVCPCLFFPSFTQRVVSSFLSSPIMTTFAENFQYYCLRPGAGAEAARILALPILLLSAVYLPGVFFIQYCMRHRRALPLKNTCVMWNLLLSSLSAAGLLVMLFSQPSLVLRPLLPEPEFTSPVRAVICLFTLTKAIEYGDTVLLALKKKPLTFLHLFHHLTVTLYCWHAQLVRVSMGHYFAFINLGIHAWMYFYYALAALYPAHPLLRSWRPLITISQILQMCVGFCLATFALTRGLPPAEHANALLAVAMYISYVILFVRFFINAYVSSHRGRNTSNFLPFFFAAQLLLVIHLLAAAGVYLLLTHKRRNTLLLEILGFSAATAAVLPLVINTHRSGRRTSSSKGSGLHRHSSSSSCNAHFSAITSLSGVSSQNDNPTRAIEERSSRGRFYDDSSSHGSSSASKYFCLIESGDNLQGGGNSNISRSPLSISDPNKLPERRGRNRASSASRAAAAVVVSSESETETAILSLPQGTEVDVLQPSGRDPCSLPSTARTMLEEEKQQQQQRHVLQKMEAMTGRSYCCSPLSGALTTGAASDSMLTNQASPSTCDSALAAAAAFSSSSAAFATLQNEWKVAAVVSSPCCSGDDAAVAILTTEGELLQTPEGGRSSSSREEEETATFNVDKREQRPVQETTPSTVASMVPGLLQRESQRCSSGTHSNSSTHSTSSTGRSLDNTSLPLETIEAAGGGGAVKEQLLLPPVAAAEREEALFFKEGSQHTLLPLPARSYTVVSRISTSSPMCCNDTSSTSTINLKTSAGYGSGPKEDLARITTAAAAAATALGKEEHSSRYVSAGYAALQSGGQTLLTISNFLLAWTLQRLVDLPEAAAAAGTAAAAAASAAAAGCGEKESEKEKQQGEVATSGRRSGSHIFPLDAAAAAAGQRALTKDKRQQENTEEEEEKGHLLRASTCCSSLLQLSGGRMTLMPCAKKRQQQLVAAAERENQDAVEQQQQRETHAHESLQRRKDASSMAMCFSTRELFCAAEECLEERLGSCTAATATAGGSSEKEAAASAAVEAVKSCSRYCSSSPTSSPAAAAATLRAAGEGWRMPAAGDKRQERRQSVSQEMLQAAAENDSLSSLFAGRAAATTAATPEKVAGAAAAAVEAAAAPTAEVEAVLLPQQVKQQQAMEMRERGKKGKGEEKRNTGDKEEEKERKWQHHMGGVETEQQQHYHQTATQNTEQQMSTGGGNELEETQKEEKDPVELQLGTIMLEKQQKQQGEEAKNMKKAQGQEAEKRTKDRQQQQGLQQQMMRMMLVGTNPPQESAMWRAASFSSSFFPPTATTTLQQPWPSPPVCGGGESSCSSVKSGECNSNSSGKEEAQNESSSSGRRRGVVGEWVRKGSMSIFSWKRGVQDLKNPVASAKELLLAATCAGVPAFYGWLIHGNALLGLCVHGALRWLLELYTSRTLYRSSSSNKEGRKCMQHVRGGAAPAAASGGTCAGLERMSNQQLQ